MKKMAIIGMSGRFPDAEDVDQFFSNLLSGRKSVKELTKAEKQESPFSSFQNFVPVASTIKGATSFDNDFFKISNIEAESTDPQQRVFLTCCYEALESSGYLGLENNVGVFGSSSLSSYHLNKVANDANWKPGFNYADFIGNDPSSLATRVAYKLNLIGPAETIECGCSSSLAAVCTACNSINNNECDMALVGGVSISFPQYSGYNYVEGSTMSKDGQILPFDKNASGIVKGDGCGVILIKPFELAKKDRDQIYAIIDGFGISNDGNHKVGYTAPSEIGETAAINQAVKMANIRTEDIDYVETHGTGTRLGDPIEIRGIGRAYKFKKDHLIGSVKANIGHLDAAAGIVGLIKVALILKNNIIPKSIGVKRLNPNLNLQKQNLKIETKHNIPIDPNSKHYCAVTSLGIGGTNVHLILENYVSDSPSYEGGNKQFEIPISAKTNESLYKQIVRITEFIRKNKQLSLSKVVNTLIYGRVRYEKMIVLHAKTINEFADGLIDLCNAGIEQLVEETKSKSWDCYNFPERNTKTSYQKVALPTYCFIGRKLTNGGEQFKPIESRSTNTNIDVLNTTSILDEMVKIWSKTLDEPVGPDDNFFELNGDSLLAVDVISNINKRLSVDCDTSVINQYVTPRLLTNYLLQKIETLPDNVQKLRDGDKGSELFLIHPAGGSTYCFKQLVDKVKTNASIYSISYPPKMRDNLSIIELAKIYKREILALSGVNRIIIGGYSFGGNVAIEVARQLEKETSKKYLVMLIDSLVPNAYASKPREESQYLKVFPLAWVLMNGTNEDIESVKAIDFSQYGIDEMISKLKRMNEIPDSMNADEIKSLFKIWVQNHIALSTQNTSVIKSNICIYSTKEQMPDFMYETTGMKKTLGSDWKSMTKGRLIIMDIPGNHFTCMNTPEYIEILADKIDQQIN